jgi:hypothetical protein
MEGELVPPVHETVVMSPHRVGGRGASRKACNTATLDPRSASVVVVGKRPIGLFRPFSFHLAAPW